MRLIFPHPLGIGMFITMGYILHRLAGKYAVPLLLIPLAVGYYFDPVIAEKFGIGWVPRNPMESIVINGFEFMAGLAGVAISAGMKGSGDKWKIEQKIEKEITSE